jgi:hypothetical protein
MPSANGNAEQGRLDEAQESGATWRKWGLI